MFTLVRVLHSPAVLLFTACEGFGMMAIALGRAAASAAQPCVHRLLTCSPAELSSLSLFRLRNLFDSTLAAAGIQGFTRVDVVGVSSAEVVRSFSVLPWVSGISSEGGNSVGGSSSCFATSSSASFARHGETGFCSPAAASLYVRNFAAVPVKQEEYNEIVDEINSKFADAREEIELALESKETVYFNEEADNARTAVKVVLDLYGGLLARLPEIERGALQRSMGLKMEQLKAELAQLNE